MGFICTYSLRRIDSADYEEIRVGVYGNSFVSLKTGRVLCESTVAGNIVTVDGKRFQVMMPYTSALR